MTERCYWFRCKCGHEWWGHFKKPIIWIPAISTLSVKCSKCGKVVQPYGSEPSWEG